MNTEHTKGPWEIWGNPGEMDIAVGPQSGGVAICQVVTVNGIGIMSEQTAQEGAANARLIAAAPCILSALQAIADTLTPPCMSREAQDGFRYHTAEDAYRVELCRLILEAKETARAAIARATGH